MHFGRFSTKLDCARLAGDVRTLGDCEALSDRA
jgi:hypothetical protein